MRTLSTYIYVYIYKFHHIIITADPLRTLSTYIFMYMYLYRYMHLFFIIIIIIFFNLNFIIFIITADSLRTLSLFLAAIVSVAGIYLVSYFFALLQCLGYLIVGLFCYICSFLLFVWLFFFTYAVLAVVYVSHVEDRFFNTHRF
jgi:hypothetical protein